jgi:RNA polymerase sigma-70 factor (ECF subfamily)
MMAGELDFERLVEAHHAALFRFAMSLARAEDEASELVQETFLTWATKGHQLSDSAKVKAWLFTTLHRDFLGKRRRQTRFPHLELDEAELELPEFEPGVTESLDWPVVLECLGKIDATFRAPVALFYLEDYSYNEIAAILDVPLGTVKSRIARGIAQLQLMLNKRPRNQRPGGKITS